MTECLLTKLCMQNLNDDTNTSTAAKSHIHDRSREAQSLVLREVNVQDLRKQEPFLSVTNRQMKESVDALTDKWQQKQVCRCHQCTLHQYTGVQMYCPVTVVAMAHQADRPHLDTAEHNTSVMTPGQNAIINLLLRESVFSWTRTERTQTLGLESSGLAHWDLKVPSTSPVSCPLSSYHSPIS